MNRTVEWPDTQLDIAGLLSRGWRPSPFREFVLKVHQRCNLSCDYCYVYTMADRSWRDRPAVMPERVWRGAAERDGQHRRAHRPRAGRGILARRGAPRGGGRRP